MNEKEKKKYPLLELHRDNSYRLFTEENVELKFNTIYSLREYIKNKNIKITA